MSTHTNTNNSTPTLLRGWISEYSAQGMEGDLWRVFQDRAFAQSRDAGWEMQGMHVLSEGCELTIFAADGSVCWSGVITAVRSGLFGLRKLAPGHPDWAPAGVTREEWASWFRHQPPLEAELRICQQTRRWHRTNNTR